MKIQMDSEMLLFIVSSLGTVVGKATDTEESLNNWMNWHQEKYNECIKLRDQLAMALRDKQLLLDKMYPTEEESRND